MVRNSSSPRLQTRKRLILWLIAVSVSVGIVGWVTIGRTLVKLPAGVTQMDYERVAQKLWQNSSQSLDRDEVLFKLGVEQTARQKWETAAALFASVDPLGSHFGREARYLQAQCVLQQDRLRESEKLFREYLADAPIAGTPPWPVPPKREEKITALHYLSYVLAVELRFEDRQVLLAELVESGDADLFDTLACHFQSLMEWNNTHGVERLENACRVSPDDTNLQAILGQYWIAQARSVEAWQLLKVCHEKLPLDRSITAACLTCLHEMGDQTTYLKMATALPPNSDGEPVELLWHRGQAALQQNRNEDARKHFKQAVTRDPANVACRLGLAKAFLALDQSDLRKQELAAAQNLVRIQNRLGWATSNSRTAEVLLEISRLSADAGLRAAAADLCRISIQLFDDRTPFEKMLRELSSQNPEGESR